jgi:alpha-glucosidase
MLSIKKGIAFCGLLISQFFATSALYSQTEIFSAKSIDGKNEISFNVKNLEISVFHKGKLVSGPAKVGMKVDGRNLSENAKLSGKPSKTAIPEGTFASSPVYKKGKVSLAANFVEVPLGDWAVELAARNDGVAYRLKTRMKGEITVEDETFELKIPKKARCHLNYTWMFGFEETIPTGQAAKDVRVDGRGRKMIYLPLVFSAPDAGVTVALTESDVFGYPNLYLKDDKTLPKDSDKASLVSTFSKWPSKTELSGLTKEQLEVSRKRYIKVKESSNYLVKTSGTRSFPWRVFSIAEKPSDLLSADIVWALATPQAKGADFSWVKPGKVAWDWWNAFDNKGNAGCTTETYKRFIDFASKTGVEYVIFDEGWSENLNIWKFHKNVDVPQLIKYAEKRGVGIILWMAWAQVYGQEEKVVEHFKKVGAKGFKVDFMDRSDADCQLFLERLAKVAAKHQMLLDYHGSTRPTGLSRTYPNVLNYEAIHGLEQMKWYRRGDMMWNDVLACYLRLSAGPMDYTPGAMDKYPMGKYRGNGRNPGSLGTRVRQMAMMALYEAPLQMLCDSPTKYEKNMESFKFMAATPVVWDDTVGLAGDPDSFAAVARKAKDGSWYAAAIGDSNLREFILDTSFLSSGTWNAEIFRDAPDSSTNPKNYVHEKIKVKAGEKIPVKMARGGGYVVKFTK